MPILNEFDTDNALYDSETDKQTMLNYSVVAQPRFLTGFRKLDIDNGNPIQIMTDLMYFNSEQGYNHVIAGGKLYDAVEDILLLRPADQDFLTGEHMRDIGQNPDDPSAYRVDFERPFVTIPKVEVFFNNVDLDNKKNWRLKTYASDIDVNGFTLNIETWGDTVLSTVQAGWIAYPEDRTHIFSTSVNTSEIRPWDRPQHQNSKAITFGNVEFWKDPTIFIALNYLDIDCKANLRINAYVDNVTRNGLTWHLDSWADTVLYGAGATIIAFNP